ncbi:unnamed protein product [Clonostachys rosea]|uniref:F-box domain-containing protein n=1 Tax=Bionectria ochroleuca TaxID=29856 RepID=A0ABY6UUZ3_BIOOC|nr:unnamed protein product [Clonostachys rosea]
MSVNELPQEILSQILGLVTAPGGSERRDRHHAEHISQARLVCRQWNSVAVGHLFHTITLRHGEGVGDFRTWHQMIDSPLVRDVASTTVIETYPETLFEVDFEAFTAWEAEGVYPAFTHAINRVMELGKLRTVQVSFSEHCAGLEYENEASGIYFETASSRNHTLRSVFSAILQRAKDPAASKIITLALINLQNLPNPDFVTTDLFRNVMEDISQLKLQIANEDTGVGTTTNGQLWQIDRRLFEPFLQQHWLAPISDQLTSLDIGFNELWGSIPAYFDGEGLLFSRLRKLRLYNFTISHHKHFDWVLAQKSLKCLILENCYIATYIVLAKADLEEWDLPTDDWDRFPDGAFGFSREAEAVFSFNGTWKIIFNRIEDELPHLVTFRAQYGTAGKAASSELNLLSPSRYIVFEYGTTPSTWVEADMQTGEMIFGDNNPSALPRRWMDGLTHPLKRRKLNVAKGRQDEDGIALDSLVKTLRQRTWCQ